MFAADAGKSSQRVNSVGTERGDLLDMTICVTITSRGVSCTGKFGTASMRMRARHEGTGTSHYYWSISLKEVEMKKMMEQIHATAVDKGWWENERNDGEIICLIHSELSEAIEALRHGNLESEHIPAFSGVEEEMADVIIRVLDYCCARGHDICGAIAAKMEFNSTRQYKHGEKKF